MDGQAEATLIDYIVVPGPACENRDRNDGAVSEAEYSTVIDPLLTADDSSIPSDVQTRRLSKEGREHLLDKPAQAVFAPFDPLQIAEAAAQAKHRLELVIDIYEGLNHPTNGHNNSPPEFLTSLRERRELISSLDALVELHPDDRINRRRGSAIREVLFRAARQVAQWTAEKTGQSGGRFCGRNRKVRSQGSRLYWRPVYPWSGFHAPHGDGC